MRILPVLLLPLAACSTTPQEAEQAAAAELRTQEALAVELAGLVPGEPTACLPEPARVQVSSKGYGSTLVYRVSNSVKYRNDMNGSCPGAGRDDILVTRTTQSRSCRGDIVQTIDRGSRFPTGACSFGDFIPYRRPAR
ncbi:hypothetical protein [uncultured Sphingomonas sp.]|uniref:hypothetical protein n=1 Tax=uncultured Sphingomonas sp. TaxID=158754 RepID=UPI0035CC6C8D